VLSLNKIAIRRGRKLLIENVSFQAHAGQRMGLIGANGSGKSSLFAMLLGELEADDGELGINPKDQFAHVAQESPNSTASGLDYVMDGDSELREVEAAIAKAESSGKEHDAGLHTLYERMEHIDGFTAEARAAKLLHGLGFVGDAIHKPVREFSGGWRMRLNLARALMCRSDILLLDEPTNHLDLPAILWLSFRMTVIFWMKSVHASHTSNIRQYAFSLATTASLKHSAPSNLHNNNPCTHASKKRSNIYRDTWIVFVTKLPKRGRHKAA